MNSLIKPLLLSLVALGVTACGHEARITGPTQCFAPNFHATRVARVGQIVQGRSALGERSAIDPTTL